MFLCSPQISPLCPLSPLQTPPLLSPPAPPPRFSTGLKRSPQERRRGGENSDGKNVARLSCYEQSLCFPTSPRCSRQSRGCIPGKETADPSTPPLSLSSPHPSLPPSVSTSFISPLSPSVVISSNPSPSSLPLFFLLLLLRPQQANELRRVQ